MLNITEQFGNLIIYGLKDGPIDFLVKIDYEVNLLNKSKGEPC